MSIAGKIETGELKQGEPDAIERLIQKWRHEASEYDDDVHSPTLERCATELEREYIGDDPGQDRGRPATATMEPHEVGPGATTDVAMALPSCTQFKGEKIINLGDADGLMIVGLFVGGDLQLQPGHEVSLVDACRELAPLKVCPAALDIWVRIRNDAAEKRRVLFEIEGRAL